MRGMPVIALAFLAGNLALQQMPRLPSGVWLVSLGFVAAAALVHRWTRPVAWALAAFVLAAVAAQARLGHRLPEAMDGRDVALTGWVDEFPKKDTERDVLSFRVAAPRPTGVPPRVRLSWYDAPPGIEAGSSLAIVARLRRPHGFVNPGGFDYERWLFLNDYGATGYVRSGSIDTAAAYGLAQAWLRLRAKLARRIEDAAGNRKAAALIRALTLGDRSGFDDADWRSLRRTGTSHLVAISGMHIGLLAMLAFAAVRCLALRLPSPWSGRDLEIGAAAAVAAAFLYAALAGFALPTRRALIMVCVALAVLVSRRKVGRFAGLATALVAVLLADPTATLRASFALSFGAVALLLVLAAPRSLERNARRRGGWRALVGLQWGITLGLLPLTGAFFGQVSLLGACVNLVAIPWFCFVLVPWTLAASAALAVPVAGSALMHAAGVAAALTWTVLAWAARVPAAAVTLHGAPVAAVLLAAAGAALALPAHRLPGRRLAWLALLPMFVDAPPSPPPGGATAIVFDVGHGLAVLVETARHRLLYDTGARFRSGFDIGRDVIVPAVHRRARGDLDALIVSHADNDHAGGAPAVIAALAPPRRLIGPDVTRLRGSVCRSGQRWRWDGVQFSILHPPPGFAPHGNETSCVLKVGARGASLLITGDIEARAERRLVALGEARADAVIVPHHGSATSSSPAFVTATRAKLAVVSAACHSRWGFPKQQVSRRWRRAGAEVLDTGRSGAVFVTLGPTGASARRARNMRPRYWRSETNCVPGVSRSAAL